MTIQDINSNVTLKLFTVILALSQPLIILYYLGEIHSISSVWDTFLQPMFIITNAATSFYFIMMSRWRFSGVMLMFLTAFSVNLYPTLHNVFALIFFVSIVFVFKRHLLYKLVYLIAIPLFFLINMFWSEVYAITVISIYHLDLLIRLIRFKKL